MADRAKERALEVYPIEADGVDNYPISRTGYIAGYHQAEKDLALTWEDVRKIQFLYQRQFVQKGAPNDEEKWYTEVLKRFIDQRK